MSEWKDPNTKGLAIVRVSSRRQEGNASHETQEAEIRSYCAREGIKLVEIIRLVESAKDSDAREKYSGAINQALTQDIRHVLFYMYDRETRNLTDAEKNTKLVRAGLLCLHYVRENKVLHKDSPSTDFFMRNIHAVMNTQFIDTLRTKVEDAMRAKADNGWFPSNHVPLGYVTRKVSGPDSKKTGSIVVRDPDEQRVLQVQREFELRAKGLSFEAVRESVVAEGFIPPERVQGYTKGSIEYRVSNRFYEGFFRWKGEEFPGKHELIIPQEIVRAARQARTRKFPQRGQVHGAFSGGWIHCALCGCNVIYHPQTRRYRNGTSTTFHYYHCSNGKGAHESLSGMNVREEELWAQLEAVVSSIQIPEALARRIAAALNETQGARLAGVRAGLEALQRGVEGFGKREDQAYSFLESGALDAAAFKRQMIRIREERQESEREVERLKMQLSGKNRESVNTVLELAKNAKELYLSRPIDERREFIEKLLCNPRLRGKTLEYYLRSPLAALVKFKQTEDWWAQLDKLVTYETDPRGRDRK